MKAKAASDATIATLENLAISMILSSNPAILLRPVPNLNA